MHLFTPGNEIHLDYVAEGINLVNGGSEDLLDILFANHSDKAIDRIHIVYPHAISAEGGLEDWTGSWADPSSHFNRLYQTDETRLTINNDHGHDEIIVTMPDPKNITKNLQYRGTIRGSQELVPYRVGGRDSRLTDVQWDILSELGWSVFTLLFNNPVQKYEARWLRFKGKTGVIGGNRCEWYERWPKKLCGLLADSFEIAGPKDVKYRIINAVEAAGLPSARGPAFAYSRLQLLDLQEKLLTNGIEAPGTITLIKDWRINVFSRGYRRLDEPAFWGDIQPAGGLINQIKDRDGVIEYCIQWKAGDSIVPPTKGGHFGARIRAHDIPWVIPLLPWIALTLSVLFNQDKIIPLLPVILPILIVLLSFERIFDFFHRIFRRR